MNVRISAKCYITIANISRTVIARNGRRGREGERGGGDGFTEGQQWRHAEGDPRRDGFRLDPEGDPGHDDDQSGRDVRVEQVIAESPAQIEDNLYAREVSGRVFNRAVGRVVVRYVELRQLDFRINDEGIRHVPQEYQILSRVRNCERIIRPGL